jgi:DNA-binding MarR family transcriptional regulator
VRAVLRESHAHRAAPLPAEIGPLLAQARNALVAAFDSELQHDQELGALEVTGPQFAVIRHALRGTARSASDLCKAMHYDRGAMSRMLDRLESKGLIRRVPLPGTRRQVALELTRSGRAAYPKMEACLERAVGRLLKGVSRSRVRQFAAVLRQMLANS